MTDPIRVLAIDDTVFYRRALSNILNEINGVEQVITAPNAEIGIQKIPIADPNLIFLDLHMEGMDGLQALRVIKERYPKIHIAMISADAKKDATHVIEALESGALEFLQKPNKSNHEENTKLLKEDLSRIIHIVQKSVGAKPARKIISLKIEPRRIPPTGLSIVRAPIDFILIGVSTGGPLALTNILKNLPPTINKPILIVQHMPPIFTQKLAEQLNSISSLTVKEAQEGDIIYPNHVYLAQGGFHMHIKSQQNDFMIEINNDPPIDSCKPSINSLLKSMSQIPDTTYLTIILTGMGDDGTNGLEILKKTHPSTFCIAQDEASSTVFGMPQSVINRNLANEILNLDDIPKRIVELCNSGLPLTN